MNKGIVILAILLIFTVGGTCLGGAESWPTTGWKTSTPEEQGMDSEKLAMMLNDLLEQKADIDGIVLIRHGNLVMESYRYPYTSRTQHVLNSCTKSMISALFGIAAKEGYIQSVDQKVIDFFPQYAPGDGMKDVSLKNLLTMSSGMEWFELQADLSVNEMTRRKDWVQYLMEQPVIATPGTKFDYNSGGSHLLSAVIAKATGKFPLDYGREKLFGPLGITDLSWDRDPKGINIGGWGLKMLPSDMAKIGYLYLRKGVWEGKEIVPAGWVEDSTRKHISTQGSLGYYGYGYQWWMTEYGGFYALGYAGQYIFVVPEKDLVVAFTSSLKINMQMPETLMREYILPSIKSAEALKPNPKAVDDINAAVKTMAKP